MAFTDYDAADKLAPSPSLAAGKGYCSSQLGQDKPAVEYFRRALDGGYDSPVVLNDLGYSLLQRGRLDEAEDFLRRALQADDTLQSAHHNLVVIHLQRALRERRYPPRRSTMPAGPRRSVRSRANFAVTWRCSMAWRQSRTPPGRNRRWTTSPRRLRTASTRSRFSLRRSSQGWRRTLLFMTQSPHEVRRRDRSRQYG